MVHSEWCNSAQYQGYTVRHMVNSEWCNIAQHQGYALRHMMQMEWCNIFKNVCCEFVSFIPINAETIRFNFSGHRH